MPAQPPALKNLTTPPTRQEPPDLSSSRSNPWARSRRGPWSVRLLGQQLAPRPHRSDFCALPAPKELGSSVSSPTVPAKYRSYLHQRRHAGGVARERRLRDSLVVSIPPRYRRRRSHTPSEEPSDARSPRSH